MPHKPRFHALGSIILGVSAIYEYGVSYLLSPSLTLVDLDYSCRRGAKEATSHPLPLPLPLSLIVLPIFSTEVKHWKIHVFINWQLREYYIILAWD